METPEAGSTQTEHIYDNPYRTVPWSSDIRKRLLVQGIEDVRCVNLEVIVNVWKEVT